MNPYDGEVYRLREELFPDGAEPGHSLEMAAFTQAVDALKDATEDELAASRAEALVAVTEEVAQRAALGKRELERRKRRRKQARESTKRNR